MLKIEIIAVGKSKRNDPFLGAFSLYSRRLHWKFSLTEIQSCDNHKEIEKINSLIDERAAVFVLDERGKTISSLEFSDKISNYMLEGFGKIQFIIGGADGLDERTRKRADFLLSFGRQTWPHMLVRTMLVEQIYRAQQIISNHPYHRG